MVSLLPAMSILESSSDVFILDGRPIEYRVMVRLSGKFGKLFYLSF